MRRPPSVMAAAVRAQWREVGQGPIAHHLSPIAKILVPASVSRVSAEAWDEAWVNAQAWA